MENKQSHYVFGLDSGTDARCGARYLICPQCGEHLRQLDLENFPRCPFCNYTFDDNLEIEDFLMEPAVVRWVHQQGAEPQIESLSGL